MLNVQEKQNSDLLQFMILPKLSLQFPLSAEHLQGWFLRARATFIPEEWLTQSRDPSELERNHDVNHQTTLVPNSSAICSHSPVLRAGTTSSECSVLQTLTSFFSPPLSALGKPPGRSFFSLQKLLGGILLSEDIISHL